MIDVKWKTGFLKINEIWFCREELPILLKSKRRTDLMIVRGVLEGKGGGFCIWNKFNTLITDLTLPESVLYEKISKKVRYQCRRSEGDNIKVCFYSSEDIKKAPELLAKFADVYDSMFRSKGMDNRFRLPIIRQYLEAGAIIFSAVWQEDKLLVFHSYICDDENVRSLHSASRCRDRGIEQSVVGRANKRLHWEDIRYFKKKGLLCYDWGGISNFENPNGIDEFKLSFGGDKLIYYNITAGKTVIGKLAVVAMKILGKVSSGKIRSDFEGRKRS